MQLRYIYFCVYVWRIKLTEIILIPTGVSIMLIKKYASYLLLSNI